MNALRDIPGLALADRWQRGFPLVSRPFAAMGAAHGLTAAETLALLRGLQERGILSRLGAVVRPNTAGASTLAALSCPPEDLERIAAIVSAERHVNHNYARDHQINLWFVVTAPDEMVLAETLARIGHKTGCPVLDLRLERPFHIDLGFGLGEGSARTVAPQGPARLATTREKQLLAAIEDGLPLCESPYAAVAAALDWTEAEVISQLDVMIRERIISRLGCVIRHRDVGFTANAMAVWDVPGEWVDAAGHRLAEEHGVTLCYRRNRVPPQWTYNLFAMVHGRDEAAVRDRVAAVGRAAGLEACNSAILFSRRCFTQRGARFSLEAA